MSVGEIMSICAIGLPFCPTEVPRLSTKFPTLSIHVSFKPTSLWLRIVFLVSERIGYSTSQCSLENRALCTPFYLTPYNQPVMTLLQTRISSSFLISLMLCQAHISATQVESISLISSTHQINYTSSISNFRL